MSCYTHRPVLLHAALPSYTRTCAVTHSQTWLQVTPGCTRTRLAAHADMPGGQCFQTPLVHQVLRCVQLLQCSDTCHKQKNTCVRQETSMSPQSSLLIDGLPCLPVLWCFFLLSGLVVFVSTLRNRHTRCLTHGRSFKVA